MIEEDYFLLGRRIALPGAGKWALPSGYIEYEEDFLTASIREVKEETGLKIEIQSIINVVSSFMTVDYHFLGIYLQARVLSGELNAGDDLDSVKWFCPSSPLPEIAFEEDKDVLNRYLKNELSGLPIARKDVEYNN